MQCPDCLGYRHPGPCELSEYDAPKTLVRHTNQTCPWCGTKPGLARLFRGRYLVGCENDTCSVNPQTGGDTLREAWDNWNRRDKP
jgi:hypothetical protein